MKMLRIIIPVFNEEKNISSCLNEIVKNIGRSSYLLYLIDDGSLDDSLKIIKRLASKYSIKIIEHKENKGVSEAFRSGIKAAVKEGSRGDIIVIMEGDGTSDPRLLPEITKNIEAGRDIVITSRYKKGGGYKNFPLQRLFYSRLANFVFQSLYPRSGAKDFTIFYRGYSYTILERALCFYTLNKLIKSKYFAANTEVLLKLLKINAKACEIPFVYDYGKKLGKSGLNIRKNIWQYAILIKNLKFFSD